MLAERKAGNKMKRKWDWGSAAMSAMMLLMGMALGFTVIADLNERGEQSLGAHLFSVMWLAMAAALALFGQLILHEGGHLVCGLATGYRFVSSASAAGCSSASMGNSASGNLPLQVPAGSVCWRRRP